MNSTGPRARQRIVVWAVIAVILAAAAVAVVRFTRTPTEQLVREASQAAGRERWEEALRLAQRALAQAPDSSPALLTAAEAASRLGRMEDALGFYLRIPEDGSRESITGAWAAAELLWRRGRLTEAERSFHRLAELEGPGVLARHRLAFLLCVEGRRWESIPFLFDLVRRDQHNLEELVLLGNTEQLIEAPLEDFGGEAAGSEPLLLLAEGRKQLRDHQPAKAEETFRAALALAPELLEAQVWLGGALLDSGKREEFVDWHRQLPPSADEHPQVWLLRGSWFETENTPMEAARCYWEAVRRDPNHRIASHRLAQTLIGVGDGARGAPFLTRSKKLQELEEVLFAIDLHRNEPARMRQACLMTEDLGRLWEARAWCRQALKLDPRLAWARDGEERLGRALQDGPPRVLASADLALQLDLSAAYPLSKRLALRAAARSGGDSEALPAVAFVDSASDSGLNFTYFNSGDPKVRSARMYEFNGGGVAVLDYDGDGWPDLYLTQGCAWPPRDGQRQHLDKLFRNLGDGTFRDVTSEADLGDDRYSQGVAVGDFDNDGFPDLYVANIGENRLYRNNGDGTMTDVTAASQTGGDRWTASALIADLNGDASPEIYAVNYLSGSDIFERVCVDRDRRLPPLCSPHVFQGSMGQLYVNRGDGQFDDRSREAGIELENSKGLGIVAADMGGSGRLNLFVANDGVPNFYFVNETDPPGGSPCFVEQAFAVGLAVDRDGSPKAGMGVAAEDADGDGLLDLLVTNFSNEGSTFFRQQPGGLFVDSTRQSNLREASLAMLGFGTQFLDGELDGLPDLVVTNGHVDNLHRMRPQYFRNVGGGRFEELPPDSLGPYFKELYLGRGLARLDWNRDGLEDYIVSHLFAPVALLTNRTRPHGHFLAVHLRGVKSARDAIGATVRLRVGDRTFVRQLTAGDGFQATNERKLVFGLGEKTRVDEMTVRWPSGLEQTFGDLDADADYLCLEGQSPDHGPIRMR